MVVVGETGPPGGDWVAQKLRAPGSGPPWAFSKAASTTSPPFPGLSGQQWALASRAGQRRGHTRAGRRMGGGGCLALWEEGPPASPGQEGLGSTGGFVEGLAAQFRSL